MKYKDTHTRLELDNRAEEFTDIVADFGMTMLKHKVTPRESELICRALNKYYQGQFGDWKSELKTEEGENKND